jgi:hypothetical protein
MIKSPQRAHSRRYVDPGVRSPGVRADWLLYAHPPGSAAPTARARGVREASRRRDRRRRLGHKIATGEIERRRPEHFGNRTLPFCYPTR